MTRERVFALLCGGNGGDKRVKKALSDDEDEVEDWVESSGVDCVAKTCFNVDTLTLDGLGLFSVIDECSQGLDNLGLESLSGPCIRRILLSTLDIVSLCMRNTYAYFLTWLF